MNEDIDNLRYPIGKFVVPENISANQIDNWISLLEEFPGKLQQIVSTLSDSQLDTTYRPGGWTIRQVVHHLSDSHINAYVRFKLAITEDNPIIKPYHEDRWAECKDAKSGSPDMSVILLQSVHVRWTAFLKTLSSEEFNRSYIHPGHGKTSKLKEAIGMYVWHGNHHLAHITETIRRNNWQI